ncbi:MAG: AAA family ATPase [Candidatus Brocadia sp.]|uniref:ATPase involved in chromosome partitioning n=1 Tax=Candidatus Brocadia fulgida TaxID=380242 RepID=A0A0M2UYT0_9BACT|nr:MAG: ATPase involved in chromosome partitioning [Candidatus Brocadia fulgida]UJS20056.1 MAG: AAA family ATPase [Candidatus Brocadia sp.]
MAKVVSFINYKGGVGKTTTTYHIGCALALFHSKKVLLIDVDPQANLTFLCAVYHRWELFKKDNGTIANLFASYFRDSFDPCQIKNIIWKSPIELSTEGKATNDVVKNLDLIPSDIDLLGVDLELASKTWRKIESGFYQEQLQILRRTIKGLKELFCIDTSDDMRDALFYLEQRHILKNAIHGIKDNYDYILIDCPPNLYLVTQNALAASDAYVITTIPDHMSTIGINILIRKIRELHDMMNHKCRLTNAEMHGINHQGILFAMVRTAGQSIVSTHKDKITGLRKDYGNACFESFISWGAGYTEASAMAVPVFLLNDENAMRVAGQYKEVTKEFLEKVNDA